MDKLTKYMQKKAECESKIFEAIKAFEEKYSHIKLSTQSIEIIMGANPLGSGPSTIMCGVKLETNL